MKSKNITSWDFGNDKNVDSKKLRNIFLEESSKFVSKFVPEKNSVKVLQNLSKEHSLKIITARPIEQKEETLSWLNTHYGDIFDKIVFTSENGDCKGDVSADLNVDIMIEDNQDHIKKITKKNVPVLLFDRYYNQDMKDENLITRVFDWKNISNEIELLIQNKYEKELRKHIKPMEYILRDFKKIVVRDSAVNTVCHGADLAIPGVGMLDDKIEMGEDIALLTGRGELIGIGMAFLNSKSIMKKKKGLCVKISKIFMQPGTYPRAWEEEIEEEDIVDETVEEN